VAWKNLFPEGGEAMALIIAATGATLLVKKLANLTPK
jgi:hypothetical protein